MGGVGEGQLDWNGETGSRQGWELGDRRLGRGGSFLLGNGEGPQSGDSDTSTPRIPPWGLGMLGPEVSGKAGRRKPPHTLPI